MLIFYANREANSKIALFSNQPRRTLRLKPSDYALMELIFRILSTLYIIFGSKLNTKTLRRFYLKITGIRVEALAK